MNERAPRDDFEMIGKTMWQKAAVIILLCIAGLAGLLWVITSLVLDFAPGTRRTPQEFAKIAASVPGTLEKVALTSSDGVKLTAWYLPARDAPGQDHWGIVLAPGGGNDKTHYLELAQNLRDTGFHVILPDLRGSGESEDSPDGTTLGITEGRDVAAAAAFLADHKHVDHIAAGGVSMGGVATVMGAAAEPRIGPLIIESSSHRAQRVFDYMLDQFGFPVGAVRSRVSGLISSVGIWRMGGQWPDIRSGALPTWRLAPKLAAHPVLFIYGDEDPLVHKEDIARFRARFAGPTQVIVAKNTGHGVYKPHKAVFTAAVTKFLDDWRNGRAMPDDPKPSPLIAEQPQMEKSHSKS